MSSHRNSVEYIANPLSSRVFCWVSCCLAKYGPCDSIFFQILNPCIVQYCFHWLPVQLWVTIFSIEKTSGCQNNQHNSPSSTSPTRRDYGEGANRFFPNARSGILDCTWVLWTFQTLEEINNFYLVISLWYPDMT